MNIRTRKVLAALAGLAFCVIGLIFGLTGQILVKILGDFLAAPDAPSLLPGRDAEFYRFLVVGICFSSGLSLTVMLWSPRPNYITRLTAYTVLLALLLPIAVYNYGGGDYLVNRMVQALLNLFLIFCGSLVVAHLYSLRSTEQDVRALQVLALLLFSLTSVFLPAMHSVIWILNQLGVLNKTSAHAIGLPTLATISSALSGFLAYMKYRRETSTANDAQPSIVLR